MWLEDTRVGHPGMEGTQGKTDLFFELAPVLSPLLKTQLHVTYWRFAVWPGRYWENSLKEGEHEK